MLTNVWKTMKENKFEVDNEINSDLICGICKSLMIKACNAPCGCRYCSDCIEQYLEENDKFCPGTGRFCQIQNINYANDIAIDNVANIRLAEITVKCPRKDCQFKDALCMIENHMRTCSKRPISCPFNSIGCGTTEVLNDEIKEHFIENNYCHSKLLIDLINNLRNELGSMKSEMIELKREHNQKFDVIELQSTNQQQKILEMERKEMDNTQEIMMLNEEMAALKNANRSLREEMTEIKQYIEMIKVKSIPQIELINKEMTAVKNDNRLLRKQMETDAESIKENIGGTSVENCERLTFLYIYELKDISNINEDKDFPIGNKSKELCEKFCKSAMIMYAQPRNHLQHCKSSFLNGEKESNLQLVYKMSCKFIKVGCVQEEYYENAIAHYSMINMIIFEDEFIKILRETVTHQTPLEDNEKTILNIVCNTFTICGQFHASPALAPRIGDIFATIMEYLKILQPIASGNMIASRISEIILYCLCNIAQKGKLNDKRGWRPILYEYYIGSKHSTEIKIASAVSISLLLTNAESKEKYKIEMEKIKEYLNDITREIIIDNRCDYFGFTQDEIEEALAGH